MPDLEVDVAVVGGGGAGLSLLLALAGRSGPPLSIALVDPVRRNAADRTWCFWDDGSSDLDPVLHRTWTRFEVVDRSGRARGYDLAPMRYAMLRSQDYYRLADGAIEALGVIRVTAAAREVLDGPVSALVRTGEMSIRARWVVDSRPVPPRRPGRTSLLQHFRGWTVRFAGDAVDPGTATLMDFGTPQPAAGVSFAYSLPLTRRRALVEYTEFSRARLPTDRYDHLLAGYLRQRWPGLGESVVVEAVEDGTIPMTDAPFARRAGRRIVRIGTAGGATRPSTGYTFSAIRRQAAGVADRLAEGRAPVPPPAYPARHRWLDAVFLRALDRGLVGGPELFTGLFEHNPPQRALRFLDGGSTPIQELAVMRSMPLTAMGCATVEDAAARLGGRLRPRRRAPDADAAARTPAR